MLMSEEFNLEKSKLLKDYECSVGSESLTKEFKEVYHWWYLVFKALAENIKDGISNINLDRVMRLLNDQMAIDGANGTILINKSNGMVKIDIVVLSSIEWVMNESISIDGFTPGWIVGNIAPVYMVDCLERSIL